MSELYAIAALGALGLASLARRGSAAASPSGLPRGRIYTRGYAVRLLDTVPNLWKERIVLAFTQPAWVLRDEMSGVRTCLEDPVFEGDMLAGTVSIFFPLWGLSSSTDGLLDLFERVIDDHLLDLGEQDSQRFGQTIHIRPRICGEVDVP